MKHYVIIGGSSGIGKSLVQSLQGKAHISATFNENPHTSSELVYWHYLNVLDPNFDWLPETIDGLVYCPGSIDLKPFKRISREQFLEDFNLQVGGAIDCIQACLPAMKKAGKASIVLFSTVAVQQGFNFHSKVAASKGAIEGLGRALAAEFAPTIRVNVIAPSLTNTSLSAHMLNTEQKIEQNAKRHPLQRIGDPNDVAKLADFLLEEGEWMTGQVIGVDGGMSTLKI